MSRSKPVFARVYERLSQKMDANGGAELRERTLAGLQGRVIEVGCGNGLNFSHYPSTVTEVVALEPEQRLRGIATAAAADAVVPIRVIDGLAEQLPAPDASFDAGVVSLVLCSVDDPAAALAELRRVIRPGGELRFYEHVRARHPRMARVQRNFDRVWTRISGGCHTHRDTLASIASAGFIVEELDRFRFPKTRVPLPPSPHILGRARVT